MNVKNQPPLLVPAEHRAELEKLSKAALMDLIWVVIANDDNSNEPPIDTFRRRRDLIVSKRKIAYE